MTTGPDAPPAPPAGAETPGGRGFWLAAVAGGAVALFGLAGLFRHADGTVPLSWARWSAGVLLAHDLVFAPLVLAGGRLLGPRLRPPVRMAVVVSGAVVVMTLPALLAAGRGRATQPGNASVLPTDYPVALAVVVAAVWAAAALAVVWSRARARRPRRRA